CARASAQSGRRSSTSAAARTRRSPSWLQRCAKRSAAARRSCTTGASRTARRRSCSISLSCARSAGSPGLGWRRACGRPTSLLSTSKRLLFVKTSSLGDVVHQCPAVTDAARAIPGARIEWVVEEGFAGVARMHACVQRVIPVAVRRWRGSLWKGSVWNEIGAFRAALATQRYDAVIDTQGLLKSALIARCASGPRHGMDRASVREPLAALFYDRTHPVPRALHAVERNRRLTAASLDVSLQSGID